MEKLAIVGCGTMGQSIALNAAISGIQVKLWGIDEENIAGAAKETGKRLLMLAENKLIGLQDIDLVKKRIAFHLSFEEVVNGSTFIIEAIPENRTLKQELFKKLEQLIKPDVIIASNTSGLGPGKLASVLANPERFIVTHFWNPAHLMPLVEVARCQFTNDNTVTRTRDLLKIMKKRPVEIRKELPGFIGNRLQCALLREAQYLLDHGYASKEDLDAAVIYGIGRRLSVTGPLASADLGGLDVFAVLTGYLFPDLDRSAGVSASLKDLVSQNKLGQKTGEGYYKWDESFSEEIMKRREKELIRYLEQDMLA